MQYTDNKDEKKYFSSQNLFCLFANNYIKIKYIS